MSTENDIQSTILDWLNLHPNGFAFRVNTMGVYDASIKGYRKPGKFTLKGTADILGIWAGKPLAIEVKKPKGKISMEQKAFINKWRESGGLGLFAFGLEEVVSYLEYFDKTGSTIV